MHSKVSTYCCIAEFTPEPNIQVLTSNTFDSKKIKRLKDETSGKFQEIDLKMWLMMLRYKHL